MELNNIEETTLKTLLKNPLSTPSLRELERATRLSVGTVSKAVRGLKEKGYVSLEKRPHALLVSVNRENEDYKWRKRIANLERIYKSGLVEALERELFPDAIVLFGSFANGMDTDKSDIDLCVVKPKGDRCEWKEYEKTLDKTINIIYLDKKSKPFDEFLSSLVQGIVLSGHLNVWALRKISRTKN